MTVEHIGQYWQGPTSYEIFMSNITLDLKVDDILVYVEVNHSGDTANHPSVIQSDNTTWVKVGGDLVAQYWIGTVTSDITSNWHLITTSSTMSSATRVGNLSILRGISNTVSLKKAEALNSTAMSPDQLAGNGQVVFHTSYSDNTADVITSRTPGVGWFEYGSPYELSTGNRYAVVGSNTPLGKPESHTVSAYRALGTAYVSTLMVGDYTPTTRTNLVKNPSFELNLSEWTTAVGSPITTTVVGAYTGTKAVGDSAAKWQIESTPIPVEVGAQYTLQVHAKRSADSLSSGNIQFGIGFLDSSGALIGGEPFGSSALPITTEWVNYRYLSSVVPEGTAYAKIYIHASLGSYYYDGVFLEEGTAFNTYFDGDTAGYAWSGTPHASTSISTEPVAVEPVVPNRTNLAENPSLETDTIGWYTYTGQTNTRDTATFYLGAASIKAVRGSTEGVIGLGYGLKYKDLAWTAQSISVASNEDLTVSVWIKAVLSNRVYDLIIYYFDTNGVYITNKIATFTAITTAWTRFSVSAVVPTAAVKAGISIETAGVPIGDGIYADALLVEKTPTLNTYFDGDTAGYAWSGTPHASTSVTSSSEPPPTSSRQSYPIDQWDGAIRVGTTLTVWDGTIRIPVRCIGVMGVVGGDFVLTPTEPLEPVVPDGTILHIWDGETLPTLSGPNPEIVSIEPNGLFGSAIKYTQASNTSSAYTLIPDTPAATAPATMQFYLHLPAGNLASSARFARFHNVAISMNASKLYAAVTGGLSLAASSTTADRWYRVRIDIPTSTTARVRIWEYTAENVEGATIMDLSSAMTAKSTGNLFGLTSPSYSDTFGAFMMDHVTVTDTSA